MVNDFCVLAASYSESAATDAVTTQVAATLAESTPVEPLIAQAPLASPASENLTAPPPTDGSPARSSLWPKVQVPDPPVIAMVRAALVT